MELFKDYVFLEGIKMVADKGVFVGTKNHLFSIPSKTLAATTRKITTTTFSYGGKNIGDAIRELIEKSGTLDQLEETMLSLKYDFPEMVHHELSELSGFKVEVNWFGSGINVKYREGKFGFKPFIQSLGKDKKKVKEFFILHNKHI